MTTKERAILFSAPMVRAILGNRKIQTRRMVKPQPEGRDLTIIESAYDWQTCTDGFLHGLVAGDHGYDPLSFRCPYGVPGDRLWVRETWATWSDGLGCADESSWILYRADTERPEPKRWRPSIFMPRSLSRILLEITDVRMQRLQEISEEDARAEGITELSLQEGEPGAWWTAAPDLCLHSRTPTGAFRRLWQSINGDGSWDVNPLVWVVSFKRLRP